MVVTVVLFVVTVAAVFAVTMVSFVACDAIVAFIVNIAHYIGQIYDEVDIVFIFPLSFLRKAVLAVLISGEVANVQGVLGWDGVAVPSR